MYRSKSCVAIIGAALSMAACQTDIGSPGEAASSPPRSRDDSVGDLGFRERDESTGDAAIADLRSAACASEVIATEPVASVLQFVVDVSGSMNAAPPDGGASRWDITRRALSTTFETLPASVSVGVLFFPHQPALASEPTGTDADPPRPVSECVNVGALIEAAPLESAGSRHRRALVEALESVTPAGGTPTYDAYQVALSALDGTTLGEDRFIVLITDGQPTFSQGCRGNGNAQRTADPRPIVGLVGDANERGIQTFVIGSPGSEQVGVPVFADARGWLSRSALAGGTAPEACSPDGPEFCHLDMTESADFASALNEALQGVVGRVVSCTYTMPLPPAGETIDKDRVNVVVTRGDAQAEVLARSEDAACAHGWRFGADGNRVELCPSTCDSLRAAPTARVEVLLGCVTRVELR